MLKWCVILTNNPQDSKRDFSRKPSFRTPSFI
ncbi:Ribosomal RNA small subunit methyltransferase C, partial [Haemophilus influenzae]